MAVAPKLKFAQELAKRISNTRGVLASDRKWMRERLGDLAEAYDPAILEQKYGLLALQVAARDEQVWTALVAARAALGKR